jgi:hypothetical protein
MNDHRASNFYGRECRASLVVAFLVCLVWLVLLSFGLFARLPLPDTVKVLLGLFVPLGAAVAIMYRTVLFRDVQQASRVLRLFGVAVALLVCAVGFLLGLSLLIFVAGIFGPE